ncbi:hypothetical protein QYF36_001128 [Acer negundo]|nr:hypothetical protein QYF36_001128 [Acer negundo]
MQKEMKIVPSKIVKAPNGDAWLKANGQQGKQQRMLVEFDDVQRIIKEPTAVAVSYGMNNKEGLIAVFDLGGRTFDVSILEIVNGVFEASNKGCW